MDASTLEEMCELIVDCPHSTPEWTDSGDIVLRNQNIKNGRLDLTNPSYTDNEHFAQRIKRAAPRAGDIVFTREAPMGDVCMIPEGVKCCLGQRQVLLRPKAEVNGKFLFFALQSPAVQQEISWNEGTGSTVSNVRIPILKKLKIPRQPGFEDQIAEMLGSVSDKIELNGQINQTLEQIAQTIFKSWFVDFEPVKAKIEAKAAGRDPERAAMCAISGKFEPELDQLSPEQYQQLAATAALFPDELVVSELGLIPEGWEVSNIGNEVEVLGGGTPSTNNSEFWENGTYHWTTPKDLSGVADKILASTERRITKAGLAKISSGLLPIDAVLMSSRAPVGYLALAKIPVAINQGYIAMKCSDRLPPTYVLQWTNSVMDEIKQRASGTTFAEISKKNFRLIQVVVPTANILKAYEKTAAEFYSTISAAISETKTLTEIRDTLLPKLLSGEFELNG